MTGVVCFSSSMASSPSPIRATSTIRSYAIDSFANFSSVAVSRTPTVTTITQPQLVDFENDRQDDDELFRDLFEPEMDANGPQRLFGGFKKAKRKTPRSNKGIQWCTGASRAQPFGSERSDPVVDAKPCMSTSAVATGPLIASAAPPPPSLSVPAPRLNIAELMTTRPVTLDNNDREEVDCSGPLARVPEVDEDEELETVGREEVKDNGRDGRPETETETVVSQQVRPFRRRRVVTPATTTVIDADVGLPKTSLTSASSLQQDTARFRDKLDLKKLMSQPRPDFKSFYPVPGVAAGSMSSTQSTTNSATVATSAGRVVDPRVEDEADCQQLVRPIPSRPLPQKEIHETSSRLAHMALTYGTTAAEPRKARKETLTRLSNPISGYSSTLQALSPDARKKRQAEINGDAGYWVSVTTTATTPPPRRKTKPLVDRLAESSNLYEAAAATTPRTGVVSKLVKGKKKPSTFTKTVPARGVTKSNNQEEGTVKFSRSTPWRTTAPTLTERKAQLKQKLASRSDPRDGAVGGGGSGGSLLGATFLTQHEESEATLSHQRVGGPRDSGRGRRFTPTKTGAARDAAGVGRVPQRPRMVSSSTPTGATQPLSTDKSTASRVRGVVRQNVSSRSQVDDALRPKPRLQARKASEGIRTPEATAPTVGRSARKSLASALPTPSPTHSRPKRATSSPNVASTKTSISSQLLQAGRAVDPAIPHRKLPATALPRIEKPLDATTPRRQSPAPSHRIQRIRKLL